MTRRSFFLIISIRLFLVASFLLILLFFLPGIVDTVQRLRHGVEKGVTVEDFLVERMHRYEVEEILLTLAKRRSRFPENAQFIQGEGTIIREIPGRILAIEETVEKIFSALPNTQVEMVFTEVPPYITKDLLQSLTQVLSSFSTVVGGGNGRVHNIILATEALNNVLLLPGEILSFHELVGPPTQERGYQLAPIIVGGEVVPGYGGGICQTATTLYNAALQADLEIVERHRHSMPIDYVPPGMDATIAYDSLDLKIKNTRSTPVIVKGWASYQVHFSILGHKEE